MRYIIEIKNNKADEALSSFMQEQGAKNADYITSYEPKERLTREVEKIGAALKEYKASGISWGVLNRYLRGSGHSQKMIDSLLKDVKQFYKEMGILD